MSSLQPTDAHYGGCMRLVFGGAKWLGGPLLWLAMLAAAGICAAGSYEHVVIVPRWIAAPPSSLAMFHGEYAIDTGRFWRVVHAPALLLCVGAFLALRRHPRRAYIGAALLGYLVLLGATAGWILPELLAITGDPIAAIAPAEW